MLLTNQQLDKLAAAHVDFAHHGMLQVKQHLSIGHRQDLVCGPVTIKFQVTNLFT
jgi:hypothetical protein